MLSFISTPYVLAGPIFIRHE